MTVKENQKELCQTLTQMPAPQRFLPKNHGADPRLQPGAPGNPRTQRRGGHARTSGLSGSRTMAKLVRRVRRKQKLTTETDWLITSLTLAELDARGLLQHKRLYWGI